MIERRSHMFGLFIRAVPLILRNTNSLKDGKHSYAGHYSYTCMKGSSREARRLTWDRGAYAGLTLCEPRNRQGHTPLLNVNEGYFVQAAIVPRGLLEQAVNDLDKQWYA